MVRPWLLLLDLVAAARTFAASALASLALLAPGAVEAVEVDSTALLLAPLAAGEEDSPLAKSCSAGPPARSSETNL